jgi:DNA (cytosine-5)-methyltransferase 1
MRVLDLFCGAGGASRGYARAGFSIVGVDVLPQPRYPYEFIQADVFYLDLDFICSFDLIHASPPCQAYTAMRFAPGKKDNPKLIEPTRELLGKTKKHCVIENVEGAPLINPIVLCGSHFDLGAEFDNIWWSLKRHRLFETNFYVKQPECRHTQPVIGVYGGHVRGRSSSFWRNGGGDFPAGNKKRLALTCMGMDRVSAVDLTMDEISEAVPPPYTHYIGSWANKAIQATRSK